MNRGRMQVYADKDALAWKFRATAFRHAADYAKGFRADPLLVKALLASMRSSSVAMRHALKESASRRAAA